MLLWLLHWLLLLQHLRPHLWLLHLAAAVALPTAAAAAAAASALAQGHLQVPAFSAPRAALQHLLLLLLAPQSVQFGA
jgi:hypothetical protein